MLYFIVGMHVILDTPGGVGLYYSYNVIAWLITVILISLGLWQITLNKKIYYSKMLLWLSLGVACLIVPVFYQFEFTDHAIPRILALVGGLLFLFSLYQFQLSKLVALQLLALILLAVIIEACFGLVQFFLFEQGFWGGYIVGSSRPHGVFIQPNVMASFMATGLVIALFLSVKNKIFQSKRLFTSLILVSLFVTSFLLILLQSRTGFVGAIAVLALTAPYIYQKNKKQLVTNFAVIAIAALSATICLENSAIPIRGEQTYENVGVRDVIFIVSADMIKTKPLIGYGYGGFERSFIDHFNKYVIENPEIGNTITNLSHPHNEVLFWVVEGGLIALIAFVFFTIGYIFTWRKIQLHKSLAVLALIFPLLLHIQLEFPFYSSISHWLVFLIMLWLVDRFALADDESYRSISCPKTFLIRFFALLIPSIFIPFLLTTLHTAHILVEHKKNPHSTQAFERLKDIINPIAWQSHLGAIVFEHILIEGLHEKNANKLKRYLYWALKRIKHTPREGLYLNSLLVLKILDQTEAYQLLLTEAKRTYPQKTNWHTSIIPRDKIDK
ncbi:PglL family O-oligosaccharyltransferase [Colwellia sp. MT41]|uniref:PglL family O-oligosaccharyltransferase n=1 Tax=Colwellia sp. MT41 TaxID=58049 RepID=UPI0012F80FBC|nr:PglL family O-oligosaccharyltransferase [Colwellia sp. MT41]